MRRWFASASVVVLTLSAVPASPAWQKTVHAAGGQARVAFVSDRDVVELEVYAMKADGSGLRRLTRNRAPDMYPDWSPDGRRIAFTSGRDGNYEIYVMNADGTDQRNLTRTYEFDQNPAWSPDGRKVAFSSTRDRNPEIYVMNADGSRQRNLTRNLKEDDWPDWSPDGRKIVFTSVRDGSRDIYVMNADGSGVRNLTHDRAENEFPTWSPDGRWIAFNSDRDGGGIYIMSSRGGDRQNLTASPVRQSNRNPDWSADGRIVFERYLGPDGNPEIYIMNADGTHQRRLTRNPTYDLQPALSSPSG